MLAAGVCCAVAMFSRSYQRLMDGRESPISSKSVTCWAPGAILTEVVKAAELLAAEGVEVTVLSVTSWSELARDGVACEQRALVARPSTARLGSRNNWQAPPGR